MLFCLTTVNAQVRCNQGDQKPPEQNDPENYPGDNATSSGQLSYDPNEVIGPEGYDSVRWVSINDVLNYTIMFENDPEFATAAAQKVDVRFDFPNKAWMKGFGIGQYSFANMSFPVAKISNAYQERIDLKDSLGYFVDLIGGLDVAKQQGFWTFTTIDPETGFAPWRAEMGLLPVNDSTHVGEGAVTFQLKPYDGLNTGDTISIQANIVFDQNDTIATNRWCNKIDAGNPKSKLTAELHPTLPNVYNLKFTGSDDENGSGVRHILLYLANHNGIYEEIDTCMVDSVLAYPVEQGKQYKLYSIAVDNTGNREPAKMEPDVVLNFNMPPTDIALSDTIFQDDLEVGGYIGKLSSTDVEESKAFTYAMAEGDGAVHNDLFQITDDKLQIKNTFKCAEDTIYKIRLSTTDEGGMSFSKAFVLYLKHVLEKPKVDTLSVNICEGDVYDFFGEEIDKAGTYRYSKSNDYMCDSLFVLNLSVLPRYEKPTVTIENSHTLVSSAEKGNQWFKEDGTPIENATEQKFTPEEDGVYYVAVSNGTCFSEPSLAYRVQLTDRIDLQLDLAKGWNWISSNLSDAKFQSATGFLAPVLDNVDRMDGANSELTNSGSELSGSLTALMPQESYKLKMDQSTTATWSGVTFRPEDNPIRLQNGWNWIGYLPVSEKPLSDAFANLAPADNDVVKSQDAFAIYNGGQWKGTLSTLKPGEGYMYYTTNAKQFTYPVTRVFVVNGSNAASQTMFAAAPWNCNKHDYRDNKTLIAEVYDDNGKALEGVYTIGAFVGDDCRGIGSYIDGLLYMTIHGTLANNESVSFRAYENATANELIVQETLAMDGMQTGNIQSPYALHVSNTTGIGNVAMSFNIYPNPVRYTMYINGDTDAIDGIKILDINGKISLSTDRYTENGVDVSSLISGVYVVALHTAKGYKYKKILILR